MQTNGRTNTSFLVIRGFESLYFLPTSHKSWSPSPPPPKAKWSGLLTHARRTDYRLLKSQILVLVRPGGNLCYNLETWARPRRSRSNVFDILIKIGIRQVNRKHSRVDTFIRCESRLTPFFFLLTDGFPKNPYVAFCPIRTCTKKNWNFSGRIENALTSKLRYEILVSKLN